MEQEQAELSLKTFLDANISHITKKDDELLQNWASNPEEHPVAEFYTGYIIITPPSRYLKDFAAELRENGGSDNLIWLIREATMYSAKLLVLDRDGPIIKTRPTFDW